MQHISDQQGFTPVFGEPMCKCRSANGCQVGYEKIFFSEMEIATRCSAFFSVKFSLNNESDMVDGMPVT